MAFIAPAFVTTNPSFIEPEIIMPYTQASGAFDTLAGGEPVVKLGDGDLFVYIKRADVRNKVSANQAAANAIQSCTIAMSYISTPTYLLRARAEYDHHDTSAASRWGVSIVEFHRLGMRQGHFQLARNALLYGLNPTAGEGLVNAQGATSINLPPDSNGNTTITTYDNGQAGLFLMGLVEGIKVRTNQMGIGRKFVFLGPQRTLAPWVYNVVQVVQFQRAGAGTTSTFGTVKSVLMDNGDEILWCYDDTLIGQGSNGHDLILVVMPEVEDPRANTEFDTNVFAHLKPGFDKCTTMYTDRAAPIEITTPLAGGATDVLSEMRITSGWAVRPEAVTLLSAQFQ
jgi:hypothetical protein